ncbi:prenyltransferase [candidate division KSB1 bacterium]|nr:prenyltransferase [candidate division KSB1 bacterium]
MRRVVIWLKAVRAPFFTATIIPVVLGTSVSYSELGHVDWLLFALTLLGCLLLHSGANLLNDFFDHLSRTDVINIEFVRPFTGGSRVIQDGLLSPAAVSKAGFLCIGSGSVIGIYLSVTIDPLIFFMGIIGVFSAFFYTAPPLALVKRGLGELFIGLNFGILMTTGSYVVQTSQFSWHPVMVSLPISFMIAAILFINEFQDYTADRSISKNQLVVRLGKIKAVYGYIIFMLCSYISIVIVVIFGVAEPVSLLGLLTLPLAIRSAQVVRLHFEDNQKLTSANLLTILNHLFTGLLIVTGYLFV